MSFFHFPKILPLLIALVLCAAVGCAAADAPAEAGCRVVWSPGSSYACGQTEVPLLVLSDELARQTLAEDEIRFFPFDAETGLYAGGEGEPAGDRAKILQDPGLPALYYVTLTKPGKYVIAGYECYILDQQVPALKALYDELESVTEKNAKPKESQTAKGLHDWLCGRVKSVIPEEDAARLSAACADPMNALLTGYAAREAYAPLYRMLLGASGIRSLTVSGTAGGEDATWTMCRLDGSWVSTDAALDDAQDKKSGKYLSLDDQKIGQDHILCENDQIFADKLLRQAAFDALADGMISASWLKAYDGPGLNFSLLWSDDPYVTVGDSMTMTFRLLSNETEKYRGMTPEAFLEENLFYFPWVDEVMAYTDDFRYPGYEDVGCLVKRGKKLDLFPPVSELCTVESAADDLSTFTVTFHAPGRYRFFEQMYVSVYLISPEQKELAALAAEMESAVADAKKASAEKDTAQQLMKWVRKKVKYNNLLAQNSSSVTFRDFLTAREGMGALLYGKCVCIGYTDAYDLLMHMAGLADFRDDCTILSKMSDHAYNLNRLDGIWSITDPTWDRFNWDKDRMDKDREANHSSIISSLFFGNAFDMLADQLAEDCLNGACLPRALKNLPLNAAEGYGFEKHLPELIDPEVSAADNGAATITLTKAEKVRVIQLDNGEPVYRRSDESEKPVSRYVCSRAMADQPVRVEIGDSQRCTRLNHLYFDDPLDNKPVLFERLDLEDGKPVTAEYHYFTRIKGMGEYNGYSHQCFVYGTGKKPVSVSWYLSSESGVILKLDILFDDEGNAASYSVIWRLHLKEVQYSWKATADGTITEYNGVPVEDPDTVPLSKVDLINFR